MIVLALDTATQATAVALRDADGRVIEARDDPPQQGRPKHSTHLLSLAKGLLGEAGADWQDLQGIAVGLGPGTFTGLRIGLASARALAQSLQIPLTGVSSLQALAAPALSSSPAGDPPPAVLAALDARRGEAFVAAYRLVPDGAGAPVELAPPRPVKPAQIAAVADEVEQQLGRGFGWTAVGDGALRYLQELQARSFAVAPPHSDLHRVSAAAILQIAASCAHAASIEDVIPEYGRRPDAELALERRAEGDKTLRREGDREAAVT